MTVPLYVPFFVLAGVCAFCPMPRWMRRVDWPVLGFWLGYFAGLAWFCVFMVWIIDWMTA